LNVNFLVGVCKDDLLGECVYKNYSRYNTYYTHYLINLIFSLLKSFFCIFFQLILWCFTIRHSRGRLGETKCKIAGNRIYFIFSCSFPLYNDLSSSKPPILRILLHYKTKSIIIDMPHLYIKYINQNHDLNIVCTVLATRVNSALGKLPLVPPTRHPKPLFQPPDLRFLKFFPDLRYEIHFHVNRGLQN